MAKKRARKTSSAKASKMRWRLLAQDPKNDRFECGSDVRDLDDVDLLSRHVVAEFDELVVDHWLHVERMDTRDWFLRVGDAMISVTVLKRGKPRLTIERDAFDIRPHEAKKASRRRG